MERVESRVKKLVYLVPVLLIPWQGGGNTALAMFVDLAVLALLLALLANSGMALPRPSRTGWWYLAFLGWASMSVIWSVNRYQTILWVVALAMVGALVVAVRQMVLSESIRERLIDLYLAVAGITAIWALEIFLTNSYERLTGPFYVANPCAAFLLPALILACVRLGQRRTVYRLSLTALLGGAILLTDSRTVLLLGAFLLIGMAVVFRKHMRIIAARFGVAAAVAILIVAGVNTTRSHLFHFKGVVQPGARFGEIAEGKSTSGSDRIVFLESAVSIWRDNPILGTGAGTYATVHPFYQKRVISASTHVHNFYAEVLADLGGIGFLLIIGLLVSILFDIKANNQNRTILVFSIIIAAILVHFAVDFETEFPVVILGLALLLGLRYSYAGKLESARYGRHLLWLLVAVLTGLGALMYQQVRAFSHHTEAAYYSNDADVVMAVSEEARAASGIFFNPDYLTKEAIYLYSSLGTMNAAQQQQAMVHALDLSRRAQQADPRDSQHYQIEGRLLRSKGDNKGAEAAFRRSLQLDPYNHPDYTMDLALLLNSEGRSTEALQAARAMLTQYPSAVIANRSTDTTLASNLANLYGLAGMIELNRNDIAAAKQSVSAGLKIDPKNLRCRALAHALSIARP